MLRKEVYKGKGYMQNYFIIWAYLEYKVMDGW